MRICCLLCLLVLPVLARAQSARIVRQPWYESALDANSITLAWDTQAPATTEVKAGDDSLTLPVLHVDNTAVTHHTYVLRGSEAAHTYYVRLISRSVTGSDSVSFYSSTASGSRSTGTTSVYFNRSIDSSAFPDVASGTGNADLLGILHKQILAANTSIDLALYSFSGITGSSVAGWLKAAASRGVKIRFIADSASAKNSTAFKALINAQIPAILNSFGANYDGRTNIHHNKIILFDARGDDWAGATVMVGSWNLSDQQTRTDFQNVVYIQDLSLARAYEREFDEEWGSTGDMPDARYSRFSTRKIDNTPRTFLINGHIDHLLFSPNGGISEAIQYELQNANRQILFSEYEFTQQALATAMEAANSRGASVHGVVGASGSGDQTGMLQTAGLDVLRFTDYQKSDTLFHHKYCLIDPMRSNATVITGSYNWTFSAESRNNENVLFLSDPTIVRAYMAEWLKRYHENGGSQTITIPSSVSVATHRLPNALHIVSDAEGSTSEITWINSTNMPESIQILDSSGRILRSLTRSVRGGESRYSVGTLPSGSYHIRVSRGNDSESVGFVVIH